MQSIPESNNLFRVFNTDIKSARRNMEDFNNQQMHILTALNQTHLKCVNDWQSIQFSRQRGTTVVCENVHHVSEYCDSFRRLSYETISQFHADLTVIRYMIHRKEYDMTTESSDRFWSAIKGVVLTAAGTGLLIFSPPAGAFYYVVTTTTVASGVGTTVDSWYSIWANIAATEVKRFVADINSRIEQLNEIILRHDKVLSDIAKSSLCKPFWNLVEDAMPVILTVFTVIVSIIILSLLAGKSQNVAERQQPYGAYRLRA